MKRDQVAEARTVFFETVQGNEVIVPTFYCEGRERESERAGVQGYKAGVQGYKVQGIEV